MRNIFLFSLLLVSISACKGPETIVVQSDPMQPVSNNDTTTAPTTSDSDEFIQFTIGELAPVNSLDPLFADSYSELRILNLIYDGLVALDESGNPVAALAKNWQVNADSTRFTFHLNTDIYFHDTNIFSGGVGRKFTSSDVRFVFERMASAMVPDRAAHMFKEIRGFQRYHLEQTLVKNSDKRAFTSIEGIKTENDSTVIFFLNKSAPDFLEKLAHPIASVYAKESTESVQAPIQKAAGTGLFYFVKATNNRHIFAVNENYNGKLPKLNRLDVISGLEEKDLFQQLARGKLNALIEPGPSTLATITDSSGQLSQTYVDDYQLIGTDISSIYRLFFNPKSNQQAPANELLSLIASSDLSASVPGSISIQQIETENTESDNRQLVITQTSHPTELYLINKIAVTATQQDFVTTLYPSYALTPEATFSTRAYPNTIKVLEWETPLFILTQKSFGGISIVNEPWNLDLSEIADTGARQ